MRGVLSSQMQLRKAVAVLGEIVGTFGGCYAERLEAGGLPGLTFVLHDREGFQEEVVSHGRKGRVVILKRLVSVPPFPMCLLPKPAKLESLETAFTGWFLGTMADYLLMR